MDGKTRQQARLYSELRSNSARTTKRGRFRRAQVLGGDGSGKYFDIVLEWTGQGTDGTDETHNTFLYDAYNEAGTLLDTDLSFPPDGTRHEYCTNEYGELKKKATWGRAYRDEENVLVVVTTNEKTGYQPCETTALNVETPSQSCCDIPANYVHISEFESEFNGTTSNVDLGNATELQGTGNKTVVVWFKTTDAISSTRSLVAKWDTTGNQRGWYLLLPASDPGKVRWIVSGDGTSTDLVDSLNTVNDGSWHMAAGVYDTLSTNRLDIYIDGVRENTNSSGIPSSLFNSSASVILGARSLGAGLTHHLPGTLRNAMIFDRALSAQEIWDLWRQYEPVTPSVGQWLWLRNDANDTSAAGNEINGTATAVSTKSYTPD